VIAVALTLPVIRELAAKHCLAQTISNLIRLQQSYCDSINIILVENAVAILSLNRKPEALDVEF